MKLEIGAEYLMQKNNSPMKEDMNLEEVTEELFTLVRSCYNVGSNDIKLVILDNCMKIILDSLENEDDLKQLKTVFDNITG